MWGNHRVLHLSGRKPHRLLQDIWCSSSSHSSATAGIDISITSPFLTCSAGKCQTASSRLNSSRRAPQSSILRQQNTNRSFIVSSFCREEQGDQLSALGLVSNAVVLGNRLYMQELLSQLCQSGEIPEGEHLASLFPLIHGYINRLGHYVFSLSEEILNGESGSLNSGINNEFSH